jgi:hypothetical protein
MEVDHLLILSGRSTNSRNGSLLQCLYAGRHIAWHRQNRSIRGSIPRFRIDRFVLCGCGASSIVATASRQSLRQETPLQIASSCEDFSARSLDRGRLPIVATAWRQSVLHRLLVHSRDFPQDSIPDSPIKRGESGVDICRRMPAGIFNQIPNLIQ